MTCRTCRQPIDTTRTWLRIERGARQPNQQTATTDRDYCNIGCLLADPHFNNDRGTEETEAA